MELTKRFCKHGHNLDQCGVYVTTKGHKRCRLCQAAYSKKYYKKTYKLAPKITHCKRGHEFTPQNTLIKTKTGGRNCKTCKNIRNKKLSNTAAYRLNGKMWAREKVAQSLPQPLRDCQNTLFELKQTIRETTAEKHGGDSSLNKRKTHCIRGHPRFGPDAYMRVRHGRPSECLHCANLLRKRIRQEVTT